jgi:hypothetical protein
MQVALAPVLSLHHDQSPGELLLARASGKRAMWQGQLPDRRVARSFQEHRFRFFPLDNVAGKEVNRLVSPLFNDSHPFPRKHSLSF